MDQESGARESVKTYIGLFKNKSSNWRVFLKRK